MAAWEASSVVETVAFASGQLLAYRRPRRKGHNRPPRKGHLHPPRKGTVLMHRIVQFVNGVGSSNKWPVHQRVYFSYVYCTNCHVRALFVNGHRLASNGHVHQWDVVAPRFLRQNGELSLTSATGNACTVRTPALTFGYPVRNLLLQPPLGYIFRGCCFTGVQRGYRKEVQLHGGMEKRVGTKV